MDHTVHNNMAGALENGHRLLAVMLSRPSMHQIIISHANTTKLSAHFFKTSPPPPTQEYFAASARAIPCGIPSSLLNCFRVLSLYTNTLSNTRRNGIDMYFFLGCLGKYQFRVFCVCHAYTYFTFHLAPVSRLHVLRVLCANVACI